MKFIAKIIRFFTSIVTDFAKPISSSTPSAINVTTTFEALTRELKHETIVTNEPTHVTHEVEESFAVHHVNPLREAEAHGSSKQITVLPQLKVNMLPSAPIMYESAAETPEIIVPTHIEVVIAEAEPVHERIAEFVMAEATPVETAVTKPKRTRKKVVAAKAPASASKKTSAKKLTKTPAKKVVTKKKTITRTRKSKEVPPEAMGFGF